MKPTLVLVAILAGWLGWTASRSAAQDDLIAPPPVASMPWNVRVSASLYAVPDGVALTLLPNLCDDAKIDAALQRLDEMVRRKEAILKGSPLVVTTSGQTNQSSTNTELRYPIEYVVTGVRPTTADQPASGGTPLAVNYDMRALGTTLEVDPTVSPDGKTIRASLQLSTVESLGTDTYRDVQKGTGVNVAIEKPVFYTAKNATDMTLLNGRPVLLGAHKLVKPEGYVEFFIIVATAHPTP